MSRFDVAAPVAPVPTPTDPVAHVAWPAEADRRRALARVGVPRLLYVAPGHCAPAASDLYEDWVRVPAGAEEVRLRSANLRRRVLERDRPER